MRQGADLIIEKTITLLEALIGVCFTVKSLDNQDLQVSSAPGEIIQDGSIFLFTFNLTIS